MAALGLNVDEIMAGLPVLQPNGRVSSWVEISVARQLWHNAYQHSKDNAIGLKVGRQLSIRAFNVLAPVLSHSPKLMDAIQNALRYQQLLSQSGAFRNVFHGGAMKASYFPASSHIPIHYAQVDSVLAGVVSALRMLVNEKIRLRQVSIVGPTRDDVAQYEQFFRCPIRMTNGLAEIEFSDQSFQIAINNADNGIYQINRALAEDRLSRLQDSEQLHASVAEVIANLQYAKADIDTVAAELLLTSRTLQRKLSRSGSSFRQIQEQVILKETIQLLSKTAVSIHEVSGLMGYAEVSSFSRAIKAITGQSPVELRRVSAALV